METFYLHDLDPVALQLGEQFAVRWYGLAYAFGFIFGFLWLRWAAQKNALRLEPQQVGDFLTWVALLGVFFGGRLGYFLLGYSEKPIWEDPLAVVQIWKGGMASHGAIFAVGVVVFVYAKLNKKSWLNLGDHLVSIAPIGIFLGRLANFVNGELYGRPFQGSWAVQFPAELYYRSWETVQTVTQQASDLLGRTVHLGEVIQAVPHAPELKPMLAEVLTPRHPSQIYEALAEGLFLFVILQAIFYMWRKRSGAYPPDGFITGCFFLLYAIARIGCEFFREPDADLILGLTAGQFFSLFMILAAAVFFWLSLRPKRESQPASP